MKLLVIFALLISAVLCEPSACGNDDHVCSAHADCDPLYYTARLCCLDKCVTEPTTQIPLDGDCSDDCAYCGSGLWCDAGTCKEIPSGPTSPPIETGQLGCTCEDNSDCEIGTCYDDGTSETCQITANKAYNAPCYEDDHCGSLGTLEMQCIDDVCSLPSIPDFCNQTSQIGQICNFTGDSILEPNYCQSDGAGGYECVPYENYTVLICPSWMIALDGECIYKYSQAVGDDCDYDYHCQHPLFCDSGECKAEVEHRTCDNCPTSTHPYTVACDCNGTSTYGGNAECIVHESCQTLYETYQDCAIAANCMEPPSVIYDGCIIEHCQASWVAYMCCMGCWGPQAHLNKIYVATSPLGLKCRDTAGYTRPICCGEATDCRTTQILDHYCVSGGDGGFASVISYSFAVLALVLLAFL